jgi:putative hydroxymethylpyrimidine transport system ATP-binding protein
MNRIELHNIELKFDDRILFRSGRININEGGIYPFLGLNGSGKTTLLRMLAGFIKPSAGSFSIKGRLLYQPQKPAVFRMTTLDNAMIGMETPDRGRALSVLADVGLSDFSEAQANTLSGGEKQRLCLCRSILAGGEVMLLDEPFSAVDHKTSDGLAAYVKEYCLRTRTTLLLVVHNLQMAQQISERFLLIRDEELVVCGPAEVREYFIERI